MREFFKKILNRRKELQRTFDEYKQIQYKNYVDLRELDEKNKNRDKCINISCPPDLVLPIETCLDCNHKVCYIHGMEHALKAHEVKCKQ